MPRYLQANYMSRKTQQRLEREAAEKTASEVPVDPEVVKQRQLRLKESLARHEKYLAE